jgi:hypothetical protein
VDGRVGYFAMNISVETYSGYKADEYPLSFTIEGRKYAVISVEDRWYGPDSSYYKVFADDANTYILKQIPGNNEWQIIMPES